MLNLWTLQTPKHSKNIWISPSLTSATSAKTPPRGFPHKQNGTDSHARHCTASERLASCLRWAESHVANKRRSMYIRKVWRKKRTSILEIILVFSVSCVRKSMNIQDSSLLTFIIFGKGLHKKPWCRQADLHYGNHHLLSLSFDHQNVFTNSSSTFLELLSTKKQLPACFPADLRHVPDISCNSLALPFQVPSTKTSRNESQPSTGEAKS